MRQACVIGFRDVRSMQSSDPLTAVASSLGIIGTGGLSRAMHCEPCGYQSAGQRCRYAGMMTSVSVMTGQG